MLCKAVRMENTALYGGARGERMQYMGQMVWLLQNILAKIRSDNGSLPSGRLLRDTDYPGVRL